MDLGRERAVGELDLVCSRAERGGDGGGVGRPVITEAGISDRELVLVVRGQTASGCAIAPAGRPRHDSPSIFYMLLDAMNC